MTVGSLLTNLSSTWFGHLVIILLGYGTIFVPGYFLIRYFKNSSFIDRAGSGFVSRLIVSCVYGNAYDKIVDESSPATPPKQPSRKDKSVFADASKLVFCFVGLQVSYLTWGVLQEKIMTKEYVGFSGSKGKFKDSQFLVFVNRILAFLLSGAYLLCTRQPRHTAPLYQYSYCSFSNIMSSWCQYEALKYVSFPTQSCESLQDSIPTMIREIISARSNETTSTSTAVLISLGMNALLRTHQDHGKRACVHYPVGVIILMGYMSSTRSASNWQGELFSQYKMSFGADECGVNLSPLPSQPASPPAAGRLPQSLRSCSSFPTFFWTASFCR
ncbi:UNVERIFIED_CONTAM: hypothetical protein GTU68_012982 [Idotea baltica]|nr:hypothetical protein [Idotea baltica]